MKRRWSLVLLVLLLIRATPAASCAVETSKMPCCAASSDCAKDGLTTASCCGMNAPAGRQESADRSRAVLLSRTPGLATLLYPALAAVADILASRLGLAAAPPHASGVPLFLKFGSLLR